MCCATTTGHEADFGPARTIDSRTNYPSACCSCSSSRSSHWRIVRLAPSRHRNLSSSSIASSIPYTPFTFSSSHKLSSYWSTIKSSVGNLFTFSYLILSCLIFLLPSSSMASPVRSLGRVDRSVPETPNWIDPCSLGAIDKVMNPSEEFKASVPKLDEKDLFQKIYSRSEVAKEHAKKVKKDFVLSIFKDASFEEDTVHMTYDWLPTLPEPSLEHLQQLKRDVAFRKSFEYLQYYAVGLEQVRIDQVLHSGEFLDDVADMEAKLRQVLCELQISMLSLRVDQNPDITRRVMSTRLRDMNSQTTRDFRDYIIIREYTKGMAYVQQVFGFYIAKLS